MKLKNTIPNSGSKRNSSKWRRKPNLRIEENEIEFRPPQ